MIRRASAKLPRSASSPQLGLWSLGGLAFSGGILAMLFAAPAAWVADELASATNGRVRLAETRGLWWHGSGVLVFTGGSGSAQSSRLPERVSWQISPTFFEQMGAQVFAFAPCCGTQPWKVAAQPRWGGFDLALNAPSWRIPAALLEGLGTPWNTLGLQAELHAKADQIQLRSRSGRTDVLGTAELDVLNARSKLSTLSPIGSYKLKLRGQSDSATVPTLELSTQQGALSLQGNGQWVAQRLRFVGRASVAQPQHEAALQNILNIVGRREGATSVITFG